MATLLFLTYFIFTLWTLSKELNLWVWQVGSLCYLITAAFFVGMPWPIMLLLCFVIGLIMVVIQYPSIKSIFLDKLYERALKKAPKLSKTEEEALNAGDTWIEQDIFVGQPNWDKLHAIETHLTVEEQAFLDNETQALCDMLDDWHIYQSMDLPENIWTFIKEKGFLGLVIHKKYGGKGFSARAHSDIVLKISSRSGPAAVTVMVPNSLGPGELLEHYGTDEQKAYYLPRLAKGLEIPCFALTEPNAGSDATSIQSQAIVTERLVKGKKILGLEISLNKRWITLAPVATLIGLALDLKDPQKLLDGIGSEGITCILVERNTENLEIGNRHLPADQPFMNGTIRGENIFVPINAIIGGQKNAGKGWQMLVECLSIGRSISLPALAGGSSSVCYLTTSAFAKIRRQFNVEIGQFEGVQEKLSEIGGINYIINAQRELTLAAVCDHKKPSVASAITKYFNTELSRVVVNNAMDVHGGRTVVLGPRNYLAGFYQGLPIAITVEGANIMSRNLLIFGQGSMACHPFIREEFYALSKEDKEVFKELINAHIQYSLKTFSKAILSAWTRGFFLKVPQNAMHRSYQKVERLSQSFAFLADLSIILLGGMLKRKERVSARLADALSYLYMAMAVLRQVKPHVEDQDERLHAQWALDYCFFHAERAMRDLLINFPIKWVGTVLRWTLFPFGQSMHYPKDHVGAKLSQIMMTNNGYRNRLKKLIYLKGVPTEAVDRVECAFQLLIEHQALLKRVGDLAKTPSNKMFDAIKKQQKQGIISASEADILLTIEKARWDAILVDEFDFQAMKQKTFDSIVSQYPSPFDTKKTPLTKAEVFIE